jgi:HEAT repeat protein
MKRFLAFTVALSVLVLVPRFAALGADADANANEETQLIGVLQNSQSLPDKADACARLKWIGTARAVPALAPLLADDQLSHSARYALESMPCAEAGAALRAALATVTGSNEVGIIDSLGVRRDAAAVPDLAKLLSNTDPPVAVAAAEALGKVGGRDAFTALQAAWEPAGAGLVHAAQCDALLAVANRFLTDGNDRQAARIFQALYDHEKDEGVRFAAFRGLILSSEKKGIMMMVAAIKEGNAPSQGAALQLAAKVGGPATTRALGELLSKLSTASQIAVLQALQQRGDRLAVSFVAGMLDNSDRDVRLAAIVALGDLGDNTVALPLANQASSATGAERTAARQALVDLRHGAVADTLVQALPTATPEVQSELIRALSERGDIFAAPKLLELAQGGNDATRSAALQGLALLAGPPQIPGLIQLVVTATNDDVRSAAADTLVSACQHIQLRGAKVDTAALAQAAQSGPRDARLALLDVCSGVSDPQIRDVLRAAVASQDEGLRAAGIRALCASQDEELLPDILAIAANEKHANFRMLGIRGSVRLTTRDQTSVIPAARKIETLKTVLQDVFNTEGKRLVLSGLATIPDVQALDMAESLLGDPEVKVEAADATVQIARSISAKHPQKAADALHRVLAAAPDATVHKSAQAALKKIKAVD